MSEEIFTFISLFIIASISVVIPLAVKKIKTFSIPVSVGEIIAGIIIGKSGFNWIQMNGQLEFLYNMGLAFVMFLSGMEINILFIKKNINNICRHDNPLSITILNFIIRIAASFIFALILKEMNIIPNTVIFIIIFCSAAVGIITPTLKEKGILNIDYGQSILMVASISNFTAMTILSLYILFLNKTPVLKLLLILLLLPVFFLCKFLANKFMCLKNFEKMCGNTSQLAVRLSYAVLLLFIVVSYLLKIEMILGAFLAGLMVSAINRKDNEALLNLGFELAPALNNVVEFTKKMKEVNCPPWYMALAPNPLDFLGAFIRDFDKVLLDIHRYPNKVRKICEELAPVFVAVGKATGNLSYQLTGSRRVFCPVWYNSFLSKREYKEFHWPFIKYIVEELIKADFTPLLSFQGEHDHLLDTILELPEGKAISWFDRTDVANAKKIIGEHSCIAGGISPSLLIGGTSEDVDTRVKEIIESMKSARGYIYTLPFNAIGPAKIENVQAMTKAVFKYGQY